MLLIRFLSALGLYALLGAYRPHPAQPARDRMPQGRIAEASASIASWAGSRWLVRRTSTISILGSTNVNKFCCQVSEYTAPDTVTLDPAGTCFLGALSVNVADFSCSHRLMTAEFKKTLRFQEHPQLRIVFLSLEKTSAFTTVPETVNGWVEVQLAGKCRKLNVTYSAVRSDDDNMELVGTRRMSFSDFALVPPRKMGGLVKVNDQLDVKFTLHLQQLK